MKVKVISVLEDNYVYLVIEESSRNAVAVDAAVPRRLLEIVRKEDVVLKAILTTHHHCARSARRDHARGNEELAQLLPGLQVFGADERVGALTHRVSHGQELAFGSIRVRCLFTPCHTSGHMCYFMWEDDSPDAPALFSGDTLFVGGCGQFFEGTAEQMLTNLTQILGALPRDTKVFCGHECTVRNLKFALKVEPENEKVKEKLAWAKSISTLGHLCSPGSSGMTRTCPRCPPRWRRSSSTTPSCGSRRRPCRGSRAGRSPWRCCGRCAPRGTTSRSPRRGSTPRPCWPSTGGSSSPSWRRSDTPVVPELPPGCAQLGFVFKLLL
nr:hydroxyacylglutathione hydrolase-like protein isoform X2 [Taeniopygia guttata]